MVQYSGFPVGAAKGKIVAMQVTMLKCVGTTTITILDRKELYLDKKIAILHNVVFWFPNGELQTDRHHVGMCGNSY